MRQRRVNRGSYDGPFSGVGLEFFPLGTAPGHAGVVLHESGYLHRNEHWNFPNVFSQFWRLIYDFAPGHQLAFPDKTVALGMNRFILVPSRCRFDCCEESPVPTFWLHFNCARRLLPKQVIPVELSPTPAEAACLAELVDLFAANKNGALTRRIYGFSLALLHLVLNREELRWTENLPPGIDRAVQHIEQRFCAALRIPALARLAGMSVRGFMRSFSRHYGIAPNKFINQVRIGEAAHLLLDTEEAVEEIAEKTGFRDRAYFSRVFKRVTRMAPAEFRRKHKAGSGTSSPELL